MVGSALPRSRPGYTRLQVSIEPASTGPSTLQVSIDPSSPLATLRSCSTESFFRCSFFSASFLATSFSFSWLGLGASAVPFHNGENSNGYRTNAKLENQSVRKLRTIGTMFVLGVRDQRWAELG